MLLINLAAYLAAIIQVQDPAAAAVTTNQSIPTYPSHFEPGEAKNTSASIRAACGTKSLRIEISSEESSHINVVKFGSKELTKLQYKTLNKIIAPLRGQIEVRVLCNDIGADLVFSEIFTRDQKPLRWIEVNFLDGKLTLVGSSADL